MPGAAEYIERTPAAELEIEPTLEQVRALAGEPNGAVSLAEEAQGEVPLAGGPGGRVRSLVPLRHSFIADCETPVSAFLKLRALAPEEPAFLLESADQGQRVGRWSFIGVRPRSVLRWSLGDPGDPYALAAELLAGFRQVPPTGDGGGGAGEQEAPFSGGAVGFFGYDLVRTVEPLGEPGEDPLGLPDMALMLSDALVIFDHLKHTVTILVNVEVSPSWSARLLRAAETIAEIRHALDGPVPHAERWVGSNPRGRCRGFSRTWRVRSSRRWWSGSCATYTPATPSRSSPPSAGPRRCPWRPSRSTGACAWSTPPPTCTSWTSATSRWPAPAPSRCSPSPAATYPRGRSRAPARAARAPRRIAASRRSCWPTRRSARSTSCSSTSAATTSGRVCEYGSVTVDELMEVETYSHVMHIVSSVSGTLRPGVGRDGRAALGAARRHALGRAEGAGDADHRRAGAGQARRLRRRGRLPELRAAISTRRSTSARSSSRTASPTSRPAGAPSRTRSRRTSTRSPWPSPGRRCARSSWPAGRWTGREGAGAGQLRLVHLQPRAVPRRAGR